jgi:hypothetical protein
VKQIHQFVLPRHVLPPQDLQDRLLPLLALFGRNGH